LSGAFVTEIIFNWDGMGVLFVEAVLSRDYPVVEAAAFIGAATTLLGSALGDFAQSLIDKRTVAR
jgi:peptide/nickel transport system permease protein